MAVIFGQSSSAELLVQCGADAHACKSFAKTALMVAALAGQLSCMESLVNGGTDILAQDDHGEIALYDSCETWPALMLRFLSEMRSGYLCTR